MAGSISEFKSSFKTDFARPNRFQVEIPTPLGLTPYIGTTRRLSFRCENAELPGRSVATTTMKIYGPEEKYPYQSTYNDITLTFIVGDDMLEKIFFDSWLEWINPSFSFDLKYKKDYVVPLRVNQYDLQNQISYSVTLIDAYPIGSNSLDLDWSADGHHKLSVTFAYTYWRNNSVQALGQTLNEIGLGDRDRLGGLGSDSSLAGVGIAIRQVGNLYTGIYQGITASRLGKDVSSQVPVEESLAPGESL